MAAESVLSFLRSPSEIAEILPGLDGYSVEGDSITAKFRLDLRGYGGGSSESMLSTAAARMQFRYTDTGAEGVTIEGSGRSLGSSLRLRLRVEVGREEQTTVAWKAEVDTGVLMKVLGRERLSNVAELIVRGIAGNAERKLSRGTDG